MARDKTNAGGDEGAASKRAGRPLKTVDGNKNLEQRRERTRRAQRAFRDRQAERLNSLTHQVSSLHQVVEDMSTTFVDLSDTLLASGTMVLDPGLVGTLKSAMQRFVASSHKAALVESELAGGDEATELPASEEEMEMRSNEEQLSQVAQEVSPSATYKSEQSSLLLASSFQEPTAMISDSLQQTLHQNPPTPKSPKRHICGTMSPRFDYGLWIGSLIPPPPPPAEFLPGKESFATRLYWRALNYGYQSLRSSDENFIKSFFRWKLRYASRQHIIWVIAKVFNDMQHTNAEFLSSDYHPGVSEKLHREIDDTAQYVLGKNQQMSESANMNAAIAKDIAMIGGSVSDYMNSAAVEQYLRDKWAIDLDSMMPGSSTPTRTAIPTTTTGGNFAESSSKLDPNFTVDIPASTHAYFEPQTFMPDYHVDSSLLSNNSSSSRAILSAQDLIDKLVSGAVTIGEGPRFSMASVDAAVMEFLGDAPFATPELRWEQSMDEGLNIS